MKTPPGAKRKPIESLGLVKLRAVYQSVRVADFDRRTPVAAVYYIVAKGEYQTACSGIHVAIAIGRELIDDIFRLYPEHNLLDITIMHVPGWDDDDLPNLLTDHILAGTFVDEVMVLPMVSVLLDVKKPDVEAPMLPTGTA